MKKIFFYSALLTLSTEVVNATAFNPADFTPEQQQMIQTYESMGMGYDDIAASLRADGVMVPERQALPAQLEAAPVQPDLPEPTDAEIESLGVEAATYWAYLETGISTREAYALARAVFDIEAAPVQPVAPDQPALPDPTEAEIESLGGIYITAYYTRILNGDMLAGDVYALIRGQLDGEVTACINGVEFLRIMANVAAEMTRMRVAITAVEVLAQYTANPAPLGRNGDMIPYILSPYYRNMVIAELETLIEDGFTRFE